MLDKVGMGMIYCSSSLWRGVRPNMQITGMIQRTELHSIGIFLISMPQGLVIKDFSLLVE